MNKVKTFMFAAGVLLVLALTISCSSGGGDSGGGSSGSSPVKKSKISGVSQKGPFVKGSAATLYELDDKLAQTGRSFRDIIADDKGSFEIKNIELVSSYAMLEADGYYRNEVTGNISTGPIKLYAIADIREKDNVNVNLLTHLEYFRVQKLVEEGKNLKDAKKQAQKDILAVFGISGEFKDSEDMSIFGASEGDAVLLAISVLLQGNLSEGQFVERLTDFRLGFKEIGVWDNEAAKNAMADWAANESLRSVRNNILSWNLSSAVPDFEKFVNDYWLSIYNFGDCNAGLQGNMKNNHKGEHYICKYNNWQRASYVEIKCSEINSCSFFTDARDNQRYASVVIGSQAWMAENLNYDVAGSKCYNNEPDNCNEYGRLYDWATAMGFDSDCNSSICVSQVQIKHHGICPNGWHIPSADDWTVLINYGGHTYTPGWTGASISVIAGINLNATSFNNCLDTYGFAALQSGVGNPNGNFDYAGCCANWWSASEYDEDVASTVTASSDPGFEQHYDYKTPLLNVRCVKD